MQELDGNNFANLAAESGERKALSVKRKALSVKR